MNSFLLLTILSISLYVIIGLVLFLIRKYIKPVKYELIFIVMSLLTVLLHYIEVIINLIRGVDFEFTSNLYLPVYPCNAIMWLNVIIIFFIFKKGKVFEVLATVSLFIGTTCGIIGLSFNENFLSNPVLSDIGILKGLLSHATMIFCCLSLGVLGFVKIRVIRSTLYSLFGFVYFFLCDLYSNFVLRLRGLEEVDNYFIRGSMEEVPFINFYTISLIGLILLILITFAYELVFVEKEERSFYNLKKKGDENA